MFAVEVRDRIMIAHSLPSPFFGPAQNLHGATFVVDAAFFGEALTKDNVVVDIGAAQDVLRKILRPLAYRNLDEISEFAGTLTTTEYLCKHIFDKLAAAAASGELGEGGKVLAKIRVTLHETDLVRAFYEGPAGI
jgi:6-pyruvoyl-tetrahydropterin synthase